MHVYFTGLDFKRTNIWYIVQIYQKLVILKLQCMIYFITYILQKKKRSFPPPLFDKKTQKNYCNQVVKQAYIYI